MRPFERRKYNALQTFSTKPLQLFSICIIGSFILSILVNTFTGGEVFRQLLFSDRIDTGMDFYNSITYTRGAVPYTQYGTLYPPLANLLFYFFCSNVPQSQQLSWGASLTENVALRATANDLRVQQPTAMMYILFVVITCIALALLAAAIVEGSFASKALFGFSLLFTTGTIWALERGNIIILVVILSLFFVVYHQSSSAVIRELALLSLAFAAGLKLYPAFLGILLIREKKWKQAIRTILYGLAMFILPFFFFEGIEGIQKFFRVLFSFNSASSDITGLSGLSLVQISKTFLAIFHLTTNVSAILSMVQWVAYASVLVGFFLCFVYRVSWKAVAMLCLFTVIVPGKMVFYGVMMMLVPLILFLRDYESAGRWKTWYFILFFFMFAVLPWPQISYFEELISSNYTYTFTQFVQQITVFLFFITLFADGLISLWNRRIPWLTGMSLALCVLSIAGILVGTIQTIKANQGIFFTPSHGVYSREVTQGPDDALAFRWSEKNAQLSLYSTYPSASIVLEFDTGYFREDVPLPYELSITLNDQEEIITINQIGQHVSVPLKLTHGSNIINISCDIPPLTTNSVDSRSLHFAIASLKITEENETVLYTEEEPSQEEVQAITDNQMSGQVPAADEDGVIRPFAN